MRSVSLLSLGLLLLPAIADAQTVRTDRPRMLLSNGSGPGTTVQAFQQRCASADYDNTCNSVGSGGGSLPAVNCAADYIVNGNGSGCASAYGELQSIASSGFGNPGQPDAHSYISNNGRSMLQFAVVRDWCDPVLSSGELDWIEQIMAAAADWYLTYAVPDVFHDDMPNVWNSIALAGLALKGTAYDSQADSYLAAADAQWKDVLLPAYAYAGDWWHEGFTYVQPSLGAMAWYAAAWTIATDEDIFAYVQANAGDLFNGYLAFHAYAMRPDYYYVYFGDTGTAKQSIELFSRYLVDLLTLGTGSTLGQGLSLEIEANARPWYDYSGADGYLEALLFDSSLDSSAAARDTLPTARWHGPGSNDIAILRSGWSADDTFIWLSCGDYFGAHQHGEVGAFQIFRHSQLSGSTGCYDSFDSTHWANYYSQHSTHANTLAIYEPGEQFPTVHTISYGQPNVNDGGQRVLRKAMDGSSFNAPTLADYQAQKTGEPYKETGDIGVFESADCHDYVACDATAAYSSEGRLMNGNIAKVSEVTRQLIFVRPQVLVVFDRVEALDASYDKRFLLHGLVTPEVNGNLVTITNGTGRLFGETLLPSPADFQIQTNFWVGEGTGAAEYPPSGTGNCDEAGGDRVEISPAQEGLRDYFLVVFEATDSADGTPPATSLTDGTDELTVTIDEGTQTTTLTLNKTAELGGHITVADSSGTTICDQDLGENAQGGSGGSGGSGAAGGAGGTGTGGAAGVPVGAQPDDDSGCGCRIKPPDRPPLAPWMLLGVLGASAAARTRRRR